MKQKSMNLEHEDTGIISLSAYLNIIYKERNFILFNILIVSLVSIIIAFIMPKTFRSHAVLMPPISENNRGIFGALDAIPLSGLFSQNSDQTMHFIAILKSRTVMENVINKYNLVNFYKADNMEDAIAQLENNMRFEVNEEGTIKISSDVTTNWFHSYDSEKNAKILSSDLSNYFIEQLDIVNKGLNTEQASFQRIFIEDRYRENVKDLKKAEDKLKLFQENNKMVSIEEQTAAAIEIAAITKGKILANEVQLSVILNILNADHPDVIKIKAETEELKSQLKNMDYGVNADNNDYEKLFPAFSKIPNLGAQLGRLKRDVEIQNTLFTFLTQQYEEAKILEAKNTPTIQVLDVAISPEKHIKPKRSIIVFAMIILAFIISIFIKAVNEKKYNLVDNAS